jgi:hypothetical protein
MSVATSTAIGLGIAGAAGIGTAAIGAHEAGNAASTQANSANYAANLQAQEAQNSLNFQEQQYNQGQQNLAPWLQSGASALGALDYGLGIGGSPSGSNLAQYQAPQNYTGAPASTTVPQGTNGQPAAPTLTRGGTVNNPARPSAGVVGASANTGLNNTGQSTLAGLSPNVNPQSNSPANPASGAPGYGSLLQGFTAPTAAQAAATPGYQFAQQQGQLALQNSAAARGGLLSGNTAEALDQYSQGLADNTYQQTYQNAFNTFNSNQANQYNRLASLAGVGQTSAAQLNSAGQAAANNIGNISQTAGAQIGQSAQNAGAATASGYVGAANAINGGINSAAGSAQQGILLNQLLNNSNSNYGPNPNYNPYNISGGG